MNVATYIDHALRDCLPPGVPTSYIAIESAYWDGRGRSRKAVGHLRMFDGQPATVEVFQAGVCIGHRYTDMPGGNAYYEGGAWLRDATPSQAGISADLPAEMNPNEARQALKGRVGWN